MAQKLACFTLDLEPDFLTEDSHEVLLNDERFWQFEEFISNNKIKLTTFVVAKMLESGLPIREKFANISNEFELHSYSHNVKEPDSEIEIVKGKEIFKKYFGRSPRGYRAPNGDISAMGLSILNREGFLYSASVFPSRRPELGFNYGQLPTQPWVYEEYPKLIEFPFAVVYRIKAIISLSFLKLFGLGFYKLMFHLFGFPDILVFDSHLYDYFPTSPVLNLSRLDWRRYALLRNQKHTLVLLQRFINFLRSKGYVFVSMSELYTNTIQRSEELPIIKAQKLEKQ